MELFTTLWEFFSTVTWKRKSSVWFVLLLMAIAVLFAVGFAQVS